MKKVAFIASVEGHIKCFHIPYLKYFKEKGFETYAITKDGEKIENCDKCINVPFERSPFSKNTFIAYKQLKKVIEKENFDIIHCHTPVAAFLTRLAARKSRKRGIKVIYTAHGFHFFKGAPLLNWLIYFPIEWFAGFFTDGLITINRQDYETAKKYLHAKNIYYTHGVGVDLSEFGNKEKNNKILEALNIPEDAKIILSVGELNNNKNHKVILKAISEIKYNNVYYLIAGKGENESLLRTLSEEYNLKERLKLLGYRNDIDELLSVADIFCFPSFREGLPVSVMEAMAAGVPCIVSDIRGNCDLIDNEKGGFLASAYSSDDFKQKIERLLANENLKDDFKIYNQEKIKNYSLDLVKEEMNKIYNTFMK